MGAGSLAATRAGDRRRLPSEIARTHLNLRGDAIVVVVVVTVAMAVAVVVVVVVATAVASSCGLGYAQPTVANSPPARVLRAPQRTNRRSNRRVLGQIGNHGPSRRCAMQLYHHDGATQHPSQASASPRTAPHDCGSYGSRVGSVTEAPCTRSLTGPGGGGRPCTPLTPPLVTLVLVPGGLALHRRGRTSCVLLVRRRIRMRRSLVRPGPRLRSKCRFSVDFQAASEIHF